MQFKPISQRYVDNFLLKESTISGTVKCLNEFGISVKDRRNPKMKEMGGFLGISKEGLMNQI